jgi:hypothetical protein
MAAIAIRKCLDCFDMVVSVGDFAGRCATDVLARHVPLIVDDRRQVEKSGSVKVD